MRSADSAYAVLKTATRFVALAIFAICTSVDAAEVTTWATAVSKQPGTGRAIVFRYAKDFRAGFSRSALPDRVILVWKYSSDSGMPAPTERRQMDAMENLLASMIEAPGKSVLTLVSTGENLREWIFYTQSEQQFFAALNQALAGHPRFPIEIHAGSDPSWSSYERFRKEVRE